LQTNNIASLLGHPHWTPSSEEDSLWDQLFYFSRTSSHITIRIS